MWKKTSAFLSICIFLVFLALLAWSIIPAEKQEDVQLLPASMMRVRAESGEQLAILAFRRVSLSWPKTMRIGDEGKIKLVFEEVPGDATSLVEGQGLTNAYSRYNVMAEVKFEAAGLRVEPANPTRESMPAGEAIHYTWKVTAEQAGSYPGDVWLSLRFLPLDGSTPVQVPIYIKENLIESNGILGLSGSMARLAGALGAMVSLLLIYMYVFRNVGTGKK